MKKLVLALAIMATAAIAQEAKFKHPGWKCRDAAVLREQLALAETDQQKISMTYQLDFAENGEPATFAEACTRIDAAVKTVNPVAEDWVRVDLTKKYAYCNGVFSTDLVAYCQANPTSYDIHVALKYHKTAWAGQCIADAIMKVNVSPQQAMTGLSALVTANINGEITDANMRELLRKMDLRYTDLLSSDKDKWSEVVAKIRTLLDRY